MGRRESDMTELLNAHKQHQRVIVGYLRNARLTHYLKSESVMPCTCACWCWLWPSFFSPICIRIHFWIINNYHIVYLIMLSTAFLKTLNKKHNLKLSHYLKSQEALRIYKYMFNIVRHRIYSALLTLSADRFCVMRGHALIYLHSFW